LIIHRAFYREATVSTLATVLVLAVLVMSQKAVVMLSGAAMGDIKATWVATLLLLDLFLDFDLLMQLALFVGVLVTLNRWYRDSEMVVMNACGVGVFDLLRPIMIFTLVFAIVVSALVMVIRPAAFNRIQEVRQANADKADLGVLAPGRFTSINGYTYFLEKGASGNRGPVFIYRQDRGSTNTVTADSARQYVDSSTGMRVLQLNHGANFQGRPGSADYQVTKFDAYDINLVSSDTYKIVDDVEGVPLMQLPAFHNRTRGLTELQTRLSKPFMLFIFSGIAMLLAYTTPRSSHYRSLFLAVLVFFFYLTVMQYVRDLMKAGVVSPVYSMWLVHGVAIFVIYRLMLRRSNGLPLLYWPFGGRK